MPNPARLVVYGTDNKPLGGGIPVSDAADAELTGSDIHEFSHQVYTIEKSYFYSLLYGVDFVRQHKPLLVVKPVDKMSVPLRSYLLKGTFLPRVEVRFYTYLEDYINLQEYFRLTMEHVRLHNMVMTLPDTKDKRLERYAHLEHITFCYQKITWLYNRGNLQFTDIWNGGFFSEEDERNFGAKAHDAPDELTEMAPVAGALQVTFTSGIFDIDPADVAFDKKTKCSFTATFSREANMMERKVYAKLFAVCNGKTEDLRQVQEGRLSEDGEWSTTFTLRKPEALGKGTESVEYYAVIESEYAVKNYKSDSIKTSGPNKSTVYFVTDENEPIVGEIVYLLKDGEAIEEYETDAEGKVVIEVEATDGEYGLMLGSDLPEESSEDPVKDWIEVELQDEEGNFFKNEPFELHFSDGSRQSGTLDENGLCRLENVPTGEVEVVFKNYPSITIKE